MPFPVGEADVAVAESALGGRLPLVLRERLMRDNGGSVDIGDDGFEMFRVLDTSQPERLARTSSRDMVRENQSLREWPGFPADALAIADNGIGDALVVLRGEASFGERLYFWEHELGDLTELGSLGDFLD